MAEESKLIENWIRGQVAKVYKKTGKAICPFAKKTLEDRKIQITMAKENVLDQIVHCCSLFNIFNLDIVILYFTDKITETKLKNICKRAHQQNPLFAIMYDHPANNGLHKGVSFSYGKAPLIMIQGMAKLKQAQEKLKQSGYYEKWDIDSFEQFY